jgi:hypothetical protein
MAKDDQKDKCSYIWENGTYSVSKAYNYFIGHEYVDPAF